MKRMCIIMNVYNIVCFDYATRGEKIKNNGIYLFFGLNILL